MPVLNRRERQWMQHTRGAGCIKAIALPVSPGVKAKLP
jgi:hypothetical protein